MTEQEVFLEFLEGFSDQKRDGKIQRLEWNEYYAAVSSSVDDDDHFIRLMRSVWKPSIKVTEENSKFIWVGNIEDQESDLVFDLADEWQKGLEGLT